MEKLGKIISSLEAWAPASYQESYDNSGLITGHPGMDINGALICLDSTEAVLDEAIRLQCNLVIAHHPIIFSGLKKLTGRNYVERTIIKALKNDIAIYAIHTNLDNVSTGVNRMICDKIGIKNPRILAPKSGLLKKLVTYCPLADADKIKTALFAAGAGAIGNYDECSFGSSGTGSFRGNENSNPAVGEKGKRHYESEERIEVIFEGFRQKSLLAALKSAHPYEEVAFDIYSLDNQYKNVGSGMVGNLESPLKAADFLQRLKSVFNCGVIRHTADVHSEIQTVAVCGGSGSFLLQDAIRAKAQVLVTSDFKYHQFFDADGQIMIADTGHYESEQFTKEIIYQHLKGKFTTFALRLSEVHTNPIKYF